MLCLDRGCNQTRSEEVKLLDDGIGDTLVSSRSDKMSQHLLLTISYNRHSRLFVVSVRHRMDYR